MFCTGDYIIYGNHGVCRVNDMGHPNIPALSEKKSYYTLVPVDAEMTIYAPVDTSIFMRKIVEREEAISLVEQIPLIEDRDYKKYIGNIKMLAELYDILMQKNDAKNLLKLIKIIYRKNEENGHEGRSKLSQTDLNYLRRAEELICNEFSIALNRSVDEVKQYIEDTVHAAKGVR